MTRIMLLVSAAFAAGVAFGEVRVSVESLELKTYPFSDPDPVPATSERRYPYFRYDGTSAEGRMQSWRAVVLENDRTRVTMLPEVGGKVWAATDKVSGQDYLYCNHVMKFRDIAVRGPWVSGGIEFNFGTIGHAPSSSAPVDWFVRTNADRSVSCFVSSREYATRTVWQVEVRLGAESDHFETHTTWFNGSGLPEPLYHWMNAAYSVRDNPEFRFAGDVVIGHSGEILTRDWPRDEKGRALETYAGNAFGGPKSYHVLPGDNGFCGIWWPSRNFGSYHRARSYAKFGRKLWLWALSREGGIWEDLLTDDDGQYAELQSGLAFNQPSTLSPLTPFKHPTFFPGATMSFAEEWGPVRDLGEIAADGAQKAPAARPVESPADFDWDSARGHCIRGVQYLRERQDRQGAAELRRALTLDANLSPAIVAMMEYELRRGRLAEVHALAARALALDAYDAEANYLDGFAAFVEGDLATSRERLGVAALNPAFRSAAYATVARGYLREGRAADALAAAEAALEANAANRDALLAKLVALRGTPEAAACARTVLARFPLMHAARYELAQAGGERDFARLVTNELPAEEFKEIGFWYAESGRTEDAKAFFARAGRDALARLALGDREGAKALPLAGAAPFRREERPLLEDAVRADGSWKFRYLLAVLKASFDEDEAARELLEGCGTEPDEAVFYAYRATHRTGEGQRDDLRRAARLGDSWRIGRALAASLSADGAWEEALRTTSDYLARFPMRNPLEIAHAQALNRNGRFAECLAFLRGVTILPSETRDNATAIWQEAQDALGLRRSWPETLGSGKPFADPPTLTVGVESSMVAVFPRAPYRRPVVDASEAKVRLARGEYESVQVLVTCQERDLKNVKVEASDLWRSAPWYAPWRRTRLARENVACETVGYAWTTFPTNRTKYSKSFSVCRKTDKPPYYVRETEDAKDAWWPDPILDFLDGVEIARGDVQSFWVRVHCPDAQPAGVYRGTLTVTADGLSPVELDFTVRVNDFAVPKASPLPLAITFGPMCYGERGEADDMAEAHARERDPEGPVMQAKSCPLAWSDFLADYYITYDSLYTQTNLNFEVLARLRDQGRLGKFNLGYWSYFKDGPNAEAEWRAETLPRLRANYEKARELGILDHAYIYGCDEINTNYFDQIRSAVKALKAEFPGVPISTTAYDDDFGVGTKLDVMDWFTPLTPKFDCRKAEASRREGHQVWWYICCGPGNPWANAFTQCPPMEMRMLMGPQTVRMRPDGFLYYEVSIWNAKRPITHGPFTDWVTRTYKTLSGDGGWTAVAAGGRPLPTLRLENFRDGLEDYAYAKLLEEKLRLHGADDAWAKRARELLAVPTSVMETMTNYTDDPAALAAWRDEMADLIESADGRRRRSFPLRPITSGNGGL